MSEAKIIIHRDPPEPGKVGKLTQAAATADAVRESRKRIHAQAKVDQTQANVIPDKEVEPPPAREDLESVEFIAPNGMVIEYGPRTDISLIDRISRLYSGRDPTVSEFRLTRVLLGIRAINGSPALTIVDEISRTKLANLVGDETIDLLMYYDRIHWPPLQQSELPVLKKKLRM